MLNKKVGFTDKLHNGYLSIEGDYPADAVRAFQIYVNKRYYNANLPITGKWNEQTEEYAKQYGKDFDNMIAKYPNSISNLNGEISQYKHLVPTSNQIAKPPMSTGVTSKGLSVQVDESGINISETKPKMSGKKIALIIGAVVVVGFIGYTIFKRMKKA